MSSPEDHFSLSKEQEYELIRKARLGDEAALNQLLDAHEQRIEGLARKRAHRYSVPDRFREFVIDELRQIGRERLQKIVEDEKKFDLSNPKRVWLWTYAFKDIKWPMNDYLKSEWRHWGREEPLEPPQDEEQHAPPGPNVSEPPEDTKGIARQDWQTLLPIVLRILGKEYGAKWLVVHVLREGAKYDYLTIASMLCDPPPTQEVCNWGHWHTRLQLHQCVPSTWSEVWQLFRSGSPRFDSREMQPRSLERNVRRLHTRGIEALRGGLGSDWWPSN